MLNKEVDNSIIDILSLLIKTDVISHYHLNNNHVLIFIKDNNQEFKITKESGNGLLMWSDD